MEYKNLKFQSVHLKPVFSFNFGYLLANIGVQITSTVQGIMLIIIHKTRLEHVRLPNLLIWCNLLIRTGTRTPSMAILNKCLYWHLDHSILELPSLKICFSGATSLSFTSNLHTASRLHRHCFTDCFLQSVHLTV